MSEQHKMRINYYVGAILAQGGEVHLENNKIVFSPTSALDRALGASDISIDFKDVQGIEYKGDLSKTLRVKTEDRIHRFMGSQASKLAALLEEDLKRHGITFSTSADENKGSKENATPSAVVSQIVLKCSRCDKSLRSDFAFCPYCQAPVRDICSVCRHATETDWKACAFCGHEFPNR